MLKRGGTLIAVIGCAYWRPQAAAVSVDAHKRDAIMFRIALGILLGAVGAASAQRMVGGVVELTPGQAVRVVCTAPNNASTSINPNNVTPPGYPATFNIWCQLRS